MILTSIINSLFGSAALLLVYFGVITALSGWDFVLDQFSRFWYFILSLAVGFGIQIGLYTYLKNVVHQSASKGVVAVSGTTSTAAMISCCAHYLANLLPVIGISGVAALIGQYQIELFWLGFLANAAGISYMTRRIIKFSHTQ